MTFLKFKIRTKLSAVFIIVVLVVIGITTTIWFTTVRSMLKSEITIKQRQVGERASEKVNEFVLAKLRALIIHSQSAAFLTQDRDLQKVDLAVFLSQDKDILELTIIDKSGMETAKTQRGGLDNEILQDRSQSPSFIANTFRYAKEYIGNVEFSSDGKPTVVISVPIIIPSSLQNLTNLSTESSIPLMSGSDLLLGVLEAKVDLSDIFAEITSLDVDIESSVFVIDKQGRVIASRNDEENKPGSIEDKALPVKEHVQTHEKDPVLHAEPFHIFEYKNLKNIPVVGSHSNIKDTSWAIIIEQPVSIVYKSLNQVLNFSIIFLVVSLGLTIPLSYFLARRITNPVLAITDGADKVSHGNLETRIIVNTDDELEDMAKAFNSMTGKLQKSIDELTHDKEIISSERNKLKVVLSGIEDAVLALDSERKVVFINTSAEKLIEISTKEAEKKPINEVLKLLRDGKEVPTDSYMGNRSNLFDQSNLTMRTIKGNEKMIHFVIGKINDSESDVHFIVTIQDITAKQKLEEMKTDFVSMAAHELRTPLTSVKGYIGTYLNDYGKDLNKDQKMLLTNANTASDKLSELVESLLELTRMERVGITLAKKDVSLVTLLDKAIKSFQKSAKLRSIDLVFKKPKESLPHIELDEMRIGEVISNLISNAIKYTNPGGKINISVSHNPIKKTITTEVADTGIGIPKDSLSQLFTKFYRVPGKLEQTARGTGLGLYISKKIVDLHNGNISVKSDVGKGSVFEFTLPYR